MKSVTIQTKTRSYPVIIGKDLLKDTGTFLARVVAPCTVAIITDDNVERLYCKQVAISLQNAGFDTSEYVFPHGEDSKNISVYSNILEFLAEKNITRADIIIALGGGVVGDIAGFCAATYLRGIRYAQIPTTFLSAIDSSVGGKTGINLNAGKNLAGAFYQPELVCCDTDLMVTLPKEYFADGIAEAIKYGVLGDKSLFETIAGGFLNDQLNAVVERCIQLKNKLVSLDEFDRGNRQLLNFGHTIGHAIEKCSHYSITHGHAVGIGMVAMAKASLAKGISEEDCSLPIHNALTSYGLPTDLPFPLETLLPVILSDKKRTGDFITLVVPKEIGTCVLHKIPIAQLPSFFGL